MSSYCIDIGANKGHILKFMYKRCGMLGKVLAVEPIPYLSNYLKKKYQKATVWQGALSDKATREQIFYYDEKHPALSRLAELPSNYTYKYKEIIVTTLRLDNLYMEEQLDFIKLDAEGAEFKILIGAAGLLKKFKPIIVFEAFVNTDYTPQELYSLLKIYGYRVSTMKHYLENKKPFTEGEFVCNMAKSYESMYIAY